MKRPRTLPLSDTPGFIPSGPGRPMTPQQREQVFGSYGPTFMRHLADITHSHVQPTPTAATAAKAS